MHPHFSYLDVAALSVILAAWVQLIPAMAAFMAIIWYGIIIWESDTVRGLTGRRDKDEYDNPEDMTGL